MQLSIDDVNSLPPTPGGFPDTDGALDNSWSSTILEYDDIKEEAPSYEHVQTTMKDEDEAEGPISAPTKKFQFRWMNIAKTLFFFVAAA